VVPGGAVVASPGGGITFRACVSGSREHERAQIRLEPKQSLIGGARVFHPEDVMNLAMVRLAALHVVNHIERHGL
jgi:hypothetical protein